MDSVRWLASRIRTSEYVPVQCILKPKANGSFMALETKAAKPYGA